MGELAEKVKKNSPFLQVEPNACIEGTYRGYSFVANRFDPDKEVYRFKIETEWGIKNWDTSSGKVAMVFDAMKDGDRVKICKQIVKASTGRETTSWVVEPVPAIGGTEKTTGKAGKTEGPLVNENGDELPI